MSGTKPSALGTHRSARAELTPGAVIHGGRFVVRGLLGHGGMATVYRGHDRRLGREVALKVMHLDPRPGSARALRFAHEVRLLARLPVHPALVRWLHAGRLGELRGRPFLCTELVPGPTLAFGLAVTQPMPLWWAVALARALAEGLVVVHRVGVVHRDLTARNVVLTGHEPGAEPVLVDFGVAALRDRAEGMGRITRADQRPGTVTAMAPEQFRGAAPHPAMDVYALGRLLYQMLTGEDPHACVSRSTLLSAHREGRRVAPPLLADTGPWLLRQLVEACLEPRRCDRPMADELSAELARVARRLEGRRPPPHAPLVSRSAPSDPGVIVVRATDSSSVGSRSSAGAHRGGIAWGLLLGVLMVVAVRGRAWVPRSPPSPAIVSTVLEPVPIAWPSVVIPHRAASARGRPARGVVPESIAIDDVDARPRPRSSRCRVLRRRARGAEERWDWPGVLEATRERRCWSDPDVRARLRLVAWIELNRFDACVDEGEGLRDPGLARLVDRCRRRRAVALAGGSR